MKSTTGNVAFLALFLGWFGVPSTALAPELQKEIASRHFVAPEDKKANPSYTTRTHSAELQSNPCHPERDGYFGSAAGKPIGLQYGYQMEITESGNSEKALNIIEDLVLHDLLTQVFPTVCASEQHRRRVQQQSQQLNETRSQTIDENVTQSIQANMTRSQTDRPPITAFRFNRGPPQNAG
jgi:hypothetical protein